MIESLKFINLNTGKEIIMDGDRADYLIDTDNGSIDWGEIQAKHSTFNFPTQIGSYISSSSLEDREVSFFGYVLGGNIQDLRRKKRLLSAFFNPLHDIEIQAAGYSLFGKAQANIVYGKEYPENNTAFCKFTISLLCNQPLWQTSKPLSMNIAVLQPGWKFPWIMVNEKGKGTIFGKRRRALLQQLTNSGATSVGAVITIHALGIVNNPELKLVETQEFIHINKTLSEGEDIVISTVDGERYIRGRKDENSPWESYLEYLDLDSSWVQLPVGTVTIGFSTFESEGVQDDTYKNMNINLAFHEKVFNLEDE